MAPSDRGGWRQCGGPGVMPAPSPEGPGKHKTPRCIDLAGVLMLKESRPDVNCIATLGR